MKRIAIPIIALFLCIFVAGAATAGNTKVLKIATISPDGTFVIDALKAASDEIEAKTDGRIKLKIYPGGVMGNDKVVLRKMRTGQIQGSTFTAGGLGSVTMNYQILSLPLLFRDYKEVDAVRAKIEPKLNAMLEKNGYISVGLTEGGFVYMMSNKPIKHPDNLKGCKVWIPEGDPVGRVVFETAGVPPVPLPLTDVLTGLQTGLIDTVASPPVATVILQWFTKVKYLTQQPLIYSYGTFAFSKKAWMKIPESDRPIVRAALAAQLKKIDKQNRKDNVSALETLKKKGMELVPLDDGAMNRMQEIANSSIDKLVSQGYFDPNLLAEIRSVVKQTRQGQ